jgi:hypothetical protein
MAFTDEQQAQVDIAIAVDNGRYQNQQNSERLSMRLETIRLAKETLIENSRSLPAGTRSVSASDIVNFALALENHINR